MAPMMTTSLSMRDFANLGLEQIAYVKPVVTVDELGFVIYAANGVRLAVLSDRSDAFALIRRHDLEPVSLH
jgi:hypothetical protein